MPFKKEKQLMNQIALEKGKERMRVCGGINKPNK